MNTKLRTLIWEQCRTGGAIALTCAASGALIMTVTWLQHSTHSWSFIRETVLLAALAPVLMAAVLQVYGPNSAGHLVGGFSTRILRLPVKMSHAVAVALIARTSFVLLAGLSLLALTHALFHNGPTLSDIIFLTQLYLLIQLLDWLRGPLRGLTSLAVLTLGVSLPFILKYFNDLQEGYELLTATTAATPPVLLLLLAATYLIALPAIRATQRGERIGIPEIWEWPKYLSLPGTRRYTEKTFNSPLTAQIWSELSRTAWRLPAFSVLMCALFLAAAWGVNSSSQYFSVPWDLLPFTAVIAAALAHGVVRPSPGNTRRQTALTVPALYPITTLDMARARLCADGIALAITLSIAWAISTLLFLFSAQGFPLQIITEALAEGETTIREIFAYLLAPLLLTGLLAWAAMATMTRLMLLLIAITSAAGFYVMASVETTAADLVSPYQTWPLIIPCVVVAAAFSAASRLGLMTRRHLAAWGAVWLLLALLLIPQDQAHTLLDDARNTGFRIGLINLSLTTLGVVLSHLGIASLSVLPIVAVTLDLNHQRHGQNCREDLTQHRRIPLRERPSTPNRKAAILAMSGLAMILLAWLKWPMEPAYKSAFRAQGLPVTLEEFGNWYSYVPEDKNLALEYLSIADSLHERRAAFAQSLEDGSWNSDSDTVDMKPGEAHMDRLPIMGNAALERAQPIPAQTWDFTLAHWNAVVNEPALRMENLDPSAYLGSRYPMNLTVGPSALELKHLARLRDLARTLALDALKAAIENEPARAADAAIATIHLANSLAREPLLISQLVRFAILSTTAKTLEDTMNRVDLAEKDLIRLQLELESALPTVDEPLAIQRAMLGELAMSMSFVEQLPSNPIAAIGKDNLFTFDRIVQIRWAFRTAEANRQAGRVVPNLDVGLQTARLEAISSWRAPLSRILLPAMGRAYEAEWRRHLQLDLARTAVALERYRLTHGRLPGTLGQLVPAFLPRVPRDPYDPNNSRIRYRIQDDGTFLLYSLSNDTEEDTGEEPNPEALKWNIIFTVAPPEARAQARTIVP